MNRSASARTRGYGMAHWVIALALAVDPGAAWAAEAPPGADQELDEVVVTGSRIVRRDYEAQTPIVTVQSETLEDRSSVGIEAALQQLPQFAPSAGAQSNSGSSTPFPSPTAAPGAATVNLRGLGSNRNLVLVDGRRVQPVNGNLTVDLNTIPSAAVQSVEVISGGAAAVYGADAISGVVNLISRKDFEGAQFDAQYGMTQQGDGEQYQVSALLGTNYADGRGNVMFGGSYASRGDINGADRDWVRAGWNDPGTSAGAAANIAGLSLFRCTRGPVPPGSPPGTPAAAGNCPTLWLPVNNGTGYSIDQNGNVFDPNDPLNADHPYTGPLGGDSGYKINPNGTLGYNDRQNSWLSVPLERYSLFASTNYDLGRGVELFTDARFTQTFTVARGGHVSLFNIWAIPVPYDPAYDDPDSPTFGQAPPGVARHPVPAPLANLLNSCIPGCLSAEYVRPNGDEIPGWTYEGGVDYLPPYRTDTTSNIFQVIAGFRGRLPLRDWRWEIYGSHGSTNVVAHLPESFLSESSVAVLFQADQYGAGWQNPEALTVTGRCTSGLPIFNPDGSVNNTPSVSQDCSDWVTLRMNNTTSIREQVLEATVQGTLLEGWAGPIQFAAGADYRSDRFTFSPDAAYSAQQASGNVVNNIALPLGVNGNTDVREVYAELAIPVLSGLPLVKKLEIDPGYRLSDYKYGGQESTWKITGVWNLNDWASVRGGVQKATRAPNLNELFMPIGAASLQGAQDGCGNWTTTPEWGNRPENPNRVNVQTLCQYLMVRDGAPEDFYVPGETSADEYRNTVFGPTQPNGAFPFTLGIQGGNPDLRSETADTITIGAVLRSPFEAEALRRLTLSFDYYDIDLKDAIGVPSGAQVYQQCLNAQFNPLVGEAAGTYSGAELAAGNPYCDLIRREYISPFFTAADRRYNAQTRNLGGIKTDGFDVQADWGMTLGFVPGLVSANVQYNKLGSFKQSPFAGAPYTERKGTWDAGFNYDWQLFSTLGYANGPFSLGLRWQHRPGLDPPSSASPFAQPVKSYDLFDLFGRIAFNQRYEIRAGIDNLLDRDPNRFNVTLVPGNPAASNNARGSSVVGQDTFGRRFYVAVKVAL
ncbi:MAG: TonB-dependent receptor [Pseudomonadota bacterium]|nr:TonB-dependent receptor [Pseudomonadota bacterium]